LETTIILRIEGCDEHEEFLVNWLEIQYLTKDLSKLLPYTIPLLVFNFNLVTGAQSAKGSEKRGLYFTTKKIWDALFNMEKLPRESYDPEKIMAQ
jgi:hypothetical protein